MSETTSPTSSWWLALLVVVALGAQAQRILTTRSATGETPFHSANDRSRWCAVAALGNYGRFEIDDITHRKDPQTGRQTWGTIDKVQHRGRDGRQHFYSSKPPLLLAMQASVYALVRLLTGLNILNYPFTASRIVLLLVNWLPLAWFWWLWARYWQRQSMHWWTLTVVMLLMLWGTFVSTFANTLNNHLPGAIAAGLSLWTLLKIIQEGRASRRYFAGACLAAGMTAVCELPALAWTAAVCLLLGQIDWRKTLFGIAVGIVPLLLAVVGINLWAHGDLRPPYAHRGVGPLVGQVDLERPADSELDNGLDSVLAHRPQILAMLRGQNLELDANSQVKQSRTPGVYELWDSSTQYRFAILVAHEAIHVHHWDDWYDYPNSYWYPENKKGVDRGEPSRWRYLFHTTIGHHGVFSLTPMWLFLPLGALAVWQRASQPTWRRLADRRVQLMLAILATSLVCFAFYMARPLFDRNYGGVSCGFRWMHWFAPLWCWLVAEGLMRLPVRVGLVQAVVLSCLALSIFSAVVPWQNPWTHPWLM